MSIIWFLRVSDTVLTEVQLYSKDTQQILFTVGKKCFFYSAVSVNKKDSLIATKELRHLVSEAEFLNENSLEDLTLNQRGPFQHGNTVHSVYSV